MKERILLIDVGNTNTDFAVATPDRIQRVITRPTSQVVCGSGLQAATGSVSACILASVVPAATKSLLRQLPVKPIVVSAQLDLGIGIRYPNRKQIGADRLANAVGVVNLYRAPAIVVGFGTAVAFDVVNARREYVGGVIAPGIAAMTHYLHEHTALLPRITPREPRSVIGKTTVDAMQVGTVIGYRGLVKEILTALRREPGMARAVVVATGGYGGLIARKIPGIQHVNPLLTLEGLRFIYRHLHESH
jgi:type III pantothenate kinase